MGVNNRPTRARISRYVEHLKQTKQKVDEMEAARKPPEVVSRPTEPPPMLPPQTPDANVAAPAPVQFAEEDSESSDDEGDEGFGPAGAAPAPAPRPNPLSESC